MSWIINKSIDFVICWWTQPDPNEREYLLSAEDDARLNYDEVSSMTMQTNVDRKHPSMGTSAFSFVKVEMKLL